MTNLNTPFMIGNVEIPNRTVLAPMAGVTNSAFRTIAKELGAGLVVMEMVSDKGIQYNNEKTLHMLHIDEGENPVSIQLFGSDEDSLARAAEFIQENTKTDIWILEPHSASFVLHDFINWAAHVDIHDIGFGVFLDEFCCAC